MKATDGMSGVRRRRAAVAVAVGVLVGSALARPGDPRPVVAVFEVQVKLLQLPRARQEMLTELLGQELGVGGVFQVMPSGDVQRALLEQSAESYKACFDERCQIELGRQLPANKLVTATLTKIGSECRVAASLYDLKRQTTDLTARATRGCRDQELVASIEEVAARLRAWRAGAAEDRPADAAASPAEPAQQRPAAGIDVQRTPGDPDTGLEWVPSEPAGLEITRSEITVAQYRACYDAGKCTSPRKTSQESECNWGRAERDAHPANCVDWHQAVAYCEWAGGRLLSEQEWQAEASAQGKRVYPWGGQDPDCARAISRLGGTGCGQGATGPVCTKAAGASLSGLCDLSGNVREWTASHWDDSGVRWVVRGGGWDSTNDSDLRASSRAAIFHTYQLRDVGFRCGRAAAR